MLIAELLLSCALALPNKKSDYRLLQDFLDKQHRGYEIVLVNEDEKLLNEDAKETPLSVEGLRIWTLNKKRKFKVIRMSS